MRVLFTKKGIIMIIAVEGADKAGKHTQVMKIVEYLNGRGIKT